MARAALRGRLSWQVARVVDLVDRDGPGPEPRARCARVARSSARPARRCPADRGGRLPGAAQLLDRHARGRQPREPHGRARPGRRGVALPGRRARGRRWAGAARTHRRLLRVAALGRSPTAARRWRQRPRAADGHAPGARGRRQRRTRPPARLGPLRGGAALSGRARGDRARRRASWSRGPSRGPSPRAGRATGGAWIARSWPRWPRRQPSDRRPSCADLPVSWRRSPRTLVDLGHAADDIRTERFGPSGG